MRRIQQTQVVMMRGDAVLSSSILPGNNSCQSVGLTSPPASPGLQEVGQDSQSLRAFISVRRSGSGE